jgi:hypothetical protein
VGDANDALLKVMKEPTELVTRFTSVNSVNTVLLRHCPDRTECVSKIDYLDSGSSPIDLRGDCMREEIGSARREALAYELDSQILGFDIVPPTVMVTEKIPKYIREVKGLDDSERVGEYETSVQLKLEGHSAWNYGIDNEGEFNAIPTSALADYYKMAIFDSIVHNTDRHAGNILITDDGRAKAIDNGLCFPIETAYVRNQFRSIPFDSIVNEVGNKLPEEVVDHLKKIDYDDFKALFKKYDMEPEGEFALRRLKKIVAAGKLLR